ncbi:hypothetical protein O7627_13260 [Solwaraspora sp. WMMD1047]|uniref:hypothetical protein n=1 Tax=Solwaraspora sp. WMMD1047 TaxID=3016102 RepID=UPI002415B9DE|nr:hypothetical protein [Solwaraspora sp. WMMD1047]MDG4830268.1 hypothetical protein [Solwaraspora sp. WMMD1047]
MGNDDEHRTGNRPPVGRYGRWRPINSRRIGGHHDNPGRVEPHRRYDERDRPVPSIGPIQGPVLFPDTIPRHVQADSLRMMLARHAPDGDRMCRCGLPLGELTGLCWYGRQAQKRLSELAPDHRAESPGEPDR